MLFSSTVFIFLFLPVTFILYFNPVLKSRKFKNIVLFLASLIFYAWGEPVYVLLLLIASIMTWIFGLLLGRASAAVWGGYRKLILVVSVVVLVGVLAVFKYATFISSELVNVGVNFPEIKIKLPIGISFYIFQMLSYVFDVYYKRVPPERDYFNVALFVSLFPQLVAGPIVRYKTVADEISNRKETWKDFEYGIRRFIIGLGKKVLIADVLGATTDAIFSSFQVANIGALTAWIGAFSYTFEIYFDFSAYSDMAIGIGRCFGFHFPENFNYPYIATNVTEFWKRWHISLTDWFRDYVYIPMGGNRVSRKKHIWNLIVVWLLTGIWHGANWTFLLWGIIYCIFQIFEKYFYHIDKLPKILRIVYTLFIVNICWVLFRADSIISFGEYAMSMFGRFGMTDVNSFAYLRISWIMFLVSAIGCTPLIARIYGILTNKSKCITGITYVIEYILLAVILIMAIFASISQKYSPFIYFNF